MRNMEDLFKAINEDKLDQCLLLDVRSKEEFQGGHIAGASNLPHDSISSDNVAELKDYQKVIVFCHMGGRAGMAHQTLCNLGLNNVVCIDENGMAHWFQQGYPTA